MQDLKVTKDRRVFLGDMEIKRVLGVTIKLEALQDPEVVLRVSVNKIDIDGYTSGLKQTE